MFLIKIEVFYHTRAILKVWTWFWLCLVLIFFAAYFSSFFWSHVAIKMKSVCYYSFFKKKWKIFPSPKKKCLTNVSLFEKSHKFNCSTEKMYCSIKIINIFFFLRASIVHVTLSTMLCHLKHFFPEWSEHHLTTNSHTQNEAHILSSFEWKEKNKASRFYPLVGWVTRSNGTARIIVIIILLNNMSNLIIIMILF